MKVSIIGSGFVGSTAAYALVLRRVVNDVLLVDLDKERAQAEASDILHAVPFVHAVNVSAGDYPDVAGSDVVIITAGVSQKPGETRLELLQRNAKVFQSVVPGVLEHAPDALLLVATNPVDVMTHLAAVYAADFGVSSTRIIGSGTTLDTARFRALLGQHLDVDPQHVHGYVVGEHGDSEVLTWSIVDIGGLPLPEYVARRGLSLDTERRRHIDDQVRNAAYHIIEGKGATYYGIGAALSRIVDVIAHNHRSILTLCTPTDDVVGVEDVTVSMPRLLGGTGVIDTLPLSLNDEETQALHDSARTIRGYLDDLGV
jgi:L-lactate dehydrogenase